ncbi:MAG: Holliday junction resolvase RuvX [Tannerella sp.]|nr:Holliday junction resolvase RuvX [Tannerella sp.]
MGRIIAIDYGQKRTGIAVTDPMRMIANGLTTVHSSEAPQFIVDYAAKETVDMMVVGLPRKMNGEPSDNMRNIEAFVNRMRKILPGLPIEFCDERFTSVMAHQAMIDGGLKRKKRQDKALVDEISAVLILQSFLESKKTGKEKSLNG